MVALDIAGCVLTGAGGGALTWLVCLRYIDRWRGRAEDAEARVDELEAQLQHGPRPAAGAVLSPGLVEETAAVLAEVDAVLARAAAPAGTVYGRARRPR